MQFSRRLNSVMSLPISMLGPQTAGEEKKQKQKKPKIKHRSVSVTSKSKYVTPQVFHCYIIQLLNCSKRYDPSIFHYLLFYHHANDKIVKNMNLIAGNFLEC